jgi:hypothetical protein
MLTSSSTLALRSVKCDARHGSALPVSGGLPMADEKRITEVETKTKHDMLGNPKEQKTTTKETDVDSSGNKSEIKTEYKEKR